MLIHGVDARREARYLRWLMRISDDMWSAVQLLGLFFLGATVLCVPPRWYSPSPFPQLQAVSDSAVRETRPATTETARVLFFTAVSLHLKPLPEATQGYAQRADFSDRAPTVASAAR
jgi:hypothetical protein